LHGSSCLRLTPPCCDVAWHTRVRCRGGCTVVPAPPPCHAGCGDGAPVSAQGGWWADTGGVPPLRRDGLEESKSSYSTSISDQAQARALPSSRFHPLPTCVRRTVARTGSALRHPANTVPRMVPRVRHHTHTDSHTPRLRAVAPTGSALVIQPTAGPQTSSHMAAYGPRDGRMARATGPCAVLRHACCRTLGMSARPLHHSTLTQPPRPARPASYMSHIVQVTHYACAHTPLRSLV
jgi:hypothetical protein